MRTRHLLDGSPLTIREQGGLGRTTCGHNPRGVSNTTCRCGSGTTLTMINPKAVCLPWPVALKQYWPPGTSCRTKRPRTSVVADRTGRALQEGGSPRAP